MGQSTDAYLFYGMTLPDDEVPDWLRKRIGADDDDDAPGYSGVSDELEKRFGVSLDTHQSCEWPVYFLAIKEGDPYGKGPAAPAGFRCAWRGTPRRVTTAHVGDDWNARLNAAADFLGWPPEERSIDWWLASNWC